MNIHELHNLCAVKALTGVFSCMEDMDEVIVEVSLTGDGGRVKSASEVAREITNLALEKIADTKTRGLRGGLQVCWTCDWYDEWTEVCCNGNSPNRADCVAAYGTCRCWEEKMEKSKEVRADG